MHDRQERVYNERMIAITIIASVLVGFAVGILSGLLGIGGGTILVPVFSVFFGMAPIGATGTSLFTIVFTSISGAVARIRNKTCVVKVGIILGLSGALTSPLGVYVALLSPEILIVIAVSVVIVYSIVSTLRKALRPSSAQTGASTCDKGICDKSDKRDSRVTKRLDPAVTLVTGAPDAGASKSETSRFNRGVVLKSICIGIVTGFLSGYVGLGGGFLMIPLMRNLLGYSMKDASGTSLLAILFIALSGALTQIYFGNVDFLVGIPVIAGSIPGAAIGSALVRRFHDKTLSFCFAGFLGIATVLFVIKQFGLLG